MDSIASKQGGEQKERIDLKETRMVFVCDAVRCCLSGVSTNYFLSTWGT